MFRGWICICISSRALQNSLPYWAITACWPLTCYHHHISSSTSPPRACTILFFFKSYTPLHCIFYHHSGIYFRQIFSSYLICLSFTVLLNQKSYLPCWHSLSPQGWTFQPCLTCSLNCNVTCSILYHSQPSLHLQWWLSQLLITTSNIFYVLIQELPTGRLLESMEK